ncbi:MAG: hypothetical protein EXQ99_05110, partial [Alphaproteobacteria bacterium]|nr:hypothetical protein [Alphaproteobacteria bacterium]
MKRWSTNGPAWWRPRRPCSHGSVALWRAMLFATILGAPIGTTLAPRAEAAQQDVLRIAAVVNDDVISIFDLSVRLAVAIRSSGFD